MHDLTWQLTIPQFANFKQQLNQYPTLEKLEPFHLQARVQNTLSRFLQTRALPHFLVFCADDSAPYHELLSQKIQNILPQKKVILAQSFDELALFGALYPNREDSENPLKIPGYLHQADNNVLILSLKSLLEQPKLWQRLKVSVINQELTWRAAKSSNYCPAPLPQNCHLHVILLGDRESIAYLEELEPSLHQLSLFAEYETDIAITDTNIESYLSVVKYFQTTFKVKPLEPQALLRLMQAGVRYTENCQFLPLCPLWFRTLLLEANLLATKESIDLNAIATAINERYYRLSYLPERALDDIYQNQILIDTQGDKIGQVNGLSLLSVPGHPLSYGEPARISCVVHFGDGDITDVERKAELGGNIHAKGMMIMQAFITSALNLTENLPFNASIVFEQSYCEIDGDSASLAKLCALVSALAQQPIKQSIALTGSVDQFGRVQPIGGINQKIESFFDVCAHRGLTGEQGVILPKANINALCLKEEVTAAIKSGQFHLWAIEEAKDAFPLLTGLELTAEDEEKETLFTLINQRVENMHHQHHLDYSLLSKLKHWFGF